LQDIAVDGERSFAKLLQIGDRSKGSSDEPLNLRRSAIDFPATFSSFSLWSAAGQHVVLGGYPAFAFTSHPLWDFRFEAGGAQDNGVTALIQN
jgi:hypothetical protein